MSEYKHIIFCDKHCCDLHHRDLKEVLQEQAKQIFLRTFCPYNDDIQIIQCKCKYCLELKNEFKLVGVGK